MYKQEIENSTSSGEMRIKRTLSLKLSKSKSLQTIKNPTLWIGTGLFLTIILALSLVQFATPGLVGNDGYYHIKTAYLLRTEGLKPVFDYLPLTVLNPDEYVDHHYLFHLLLIPFTFGDLRTGAKLASVFFPALAFLSVWWMLRKQKIEFSELWTLGLLVISEAFLYRMNMPRAQSLSLLILVLALYAILQKKSRLLIPLGFLYVWSYNAFPLLLFVAVAYTAASWLINRDFLWRPIVYSTAGIGLGLILNPYFPQNLTFIYRHLVPKLVDATSVSVGSEWFPYKTTTLMENSGIALILLLVGILALGLNEKKIDIPTTTSLFLVMGFGFMLFQSRRFIEYAPPFMLIFAAFALNPLIKQWKENSTKSRNNSDDRPKLMEKIRSRLLVVIILILMIPMIWINLSTSRKVLQENAKPYLRYAEASAWLENNTPKNSRVFQTDWDDFPQLFFYNHHNTYTIGLDPTYMQQYDNELYSQWVKITKGEVANPGKDILTLFGGQYVVTDLNHKDFIRKAQEDPDLVEVYQDEYAIIFQIDN